MLSIHLQTTIVGEGPASVALGDVNDDGVLDIVTANQTSNDLSILLGRGDASFAEAQAWSIGVSPTALALGDVNDDGVLDVVIATDANDVLILLGHGDASFVEPLHYPVGNRPASVTLGDVDGDGVLDVLTANRVSDDVSTLLAGGTGGFVAEQRFDVGNSPSSVALVDVQGRRFDVNRDGFSDAVVTNRDNNSATILLSTAFLKNMPHTQQLRDMTMDGREEPVFYLTLQEDVPPGPNRTLTVRAFLPHASEPDWIGRTTQTISSLDTSVVVHLTSTAGSE